MRFAGNRSLSPADFLTVDPDRLSVTGQVDTDGLFRGSAGENVARTSASQLTRDVNRKCLNEMSR